MLSLIALISDLRKNENTKNHPAMDEAQALMRKVVAFGGKIADDDIKQLLERLKHEHSSTTQN